MSENASAEMLQVTLKQESGHSGVGVEVLNYSTPNPHTHADHESTKKRVSLYHPKSNRVRSGNNAPMAANLLTYLCQNPGWVPLKGNMKRGRNLAEYPPGITSVQVLARLDEECHVSIWDAVQKKKITGASSPLKRNLGKYFVTHPDHVVYTGQKPSERELKKRKRASAYVKMVEIKDVKKMKKSITLQPCKNDQDENNPCGQGTPENKRKSADEEFIVVKRIKGIRKNIHVTFAKEEGNVALRREERIPVLLVPRRANDTKCSERSHYGLDKGHNAKDDVSYCSSTVLPSNYEWTDRFLHDIYGPYLTETRRDRIEDDMSLPSVPESMHVLTVFNFLPGSRRN